MHNATTADNIIPNKNDTDIERDAAESERAPTPHPAGFMSAERIDADLFNKAVCSYG